MSASISANPPSPENPSATAGTRLMSVDALRGFDMFWIIGADALVYALNRISEGQSHGGENHGFFGFLADQLEHAPWAGFHFYDLIFPMFLFIVGVSTVFSLTKTIKTVGRAGALRRVIQRGLLLYVVGLLYSGGIRDGLLDVRWMGVLNRIAICYLVSGLIFCTCNWRVMIGICASLLIGYWALMSFYPIRNIQLERKSFDQLAQTEANKDLRADYEAQRQNDRNNDKKHILPTERIMFARETSRVTGHFEHGFNVSDHFDFQYLPGFKYDGGYFDPEGFLSTFPAIATCLLGVFAGLLLRNTSVPDMQKVKYLVCAGIGAAILGWLWNLQFPVCKKIWTSSFVLVAGGYATLFLATFYYVVDILKYRAWCQPFVWMGMNSITVYLASNLIGGFRKLAARFVGGDIQTFFEKNVHRGAGDMVIAVVGLILAFWFVNFLYRKKLFLRL